MKFRIFLILALLVGAAALSSLTVRVFVWPVTPNLPSTGYLRVYYDGQTPPAWQQFRMPPLNDPCHFDIELPDIPNNGTIHAEVATIAGIEHQRQRVSNPYFVFYL